MNKQQLNEPLNIEDSIIQLIVEEGKQGSEQAKEAIRFLVSVLTPRQRKQVLKKVRICKFYIRSMEKRIDKKRIRSIIANKESVLRQNMTETCKPCNDYYISNVKSKNNVMW